MNPNAFYISRKLIYRQAVLLVPIISVFVVAVLSLYEAHRYREAGRELEVNKRQIAQLNGLIKALDAKPPITVVPVILQSPAEQPDFIDALRTRAEEYHVNLTRWANATGTGANSSAAASSGSGEGAVPGDVTCINCSIEATGRYNDLRHFLYSLQDAPRLFTLSDMMWSRNDKWPVTSLKFNLARYITLNGSAPAHMPLPTKAAADALKTDKVVVDTTQWHAGANDPMHPAPATDNLAPGAVKVSDMRGTQ